VSWQIVSFGNFESPDALGCLLMCPSLLFSLPSLEVTDCRVVSLSEDLCGLSSPGKGEIGKDSAAVTGAILQPEAW